MGDGERVGGVWDDEGPCDDPEGEVEWGDAGGDGAVEVVGGGDYGWGQGEPGTSSRCLGCQVAGKVGVPVQ